MTLGEFSTLFQMVLLASLEALRKVLKHLCTHHREVRLNNLKVPSHIDFLRKVVLGTWAGKGVTPYIPIKQ